jgi:hypothetical protein
MFRGMTPHHFFPPIAVEYFACSKCRSLHGGLYGKGIPQYFKTEGADRCWHSWKQITAEEFRSRAEAEFPYQWAHSPEWFKRPLAPKDPSRAA